MRHIKKNLSTSESELSPKLSPLIENTSEGPIFRQNRFNHHSVQLELRLKDYSFPIKNWSRSGIAFLIPQNQSQTFHSKQQIPAKIYYQDIALFDGLLQISRVDGSERPGGTIVGAAFVRDFFKVESVESVIHIKETDKEVTSLTHSVSDMDPEFCRSIVVLQIFLQLVKNACKKEEDRWKSLPADLRFEAEEVFLEGMADQVRLHLSPFNQLIKKKIQIEDFLEKSIYYKLFDQLISPFFQDADLVKRARMKEKGYAGDYEMMNQVYRSGFEGKSLFGKTLNQYAVSETCANSIEFKKSYLFSKYEELRQAHQNEIKILSIANNPAFEFQEVISAWSQPDLDRLKVTLFDMDQEALEHSQRKIWKYSISSQKNFKPQFVHSSVRVFLNTQQFRQEKFDLIYVGNLFDTLESKMCKSILHALYPLLKLGGKIVIENATDQSDHSAFLHLICRWPLIHKSSNEMQMWVEDLSGAHAMIDRGKNETLAFLVVTRTT